MSKHCLQQNLLATIANLLCRFLRITIFVAARGKQQPLNASPGCRWLLFSRGLTNPLGLAPRALGRDR